MDEPYVVGKLSILEAWICSFSRMGQKINYSSLKFLHENLKMFLSTEHLSCASRGMDNFSLALLHKPYFVGKLLII